MSDERDSALQRCADDRCCNCAPARRAAPRRPGSPGWRTHWANDRAAPINARVEKVAHNPFFRAIWPHRAITPIDNGFEWVDEGGPKKQPSLARKNSIRQL
ncbi:SOS response-associated peptidase family protein [Pseudomonas sp. 37 R 15]|uniref:SOS response-associated peptidase family protein n=1 Tax=Pseudomonas sp. 37 R 15 TaxID=1844104 RepID=UPI0035322EF0